MMDEALKKSGDWPNIAITPGTRRHAATGEPVEQPENTRIGHPRGACRPDNADCDSEPAAVENRPQDGAECDTREKLLDNIWREITTTLINDERLHDPNFWYANILWWLDRQAAITHREVSCQSDERDEQIAELTAERDNLQAYINRKQLAHDHIGMVEQIAELTAERDSLRERLKTQANSFQKLERDNAKLRDTLARVQELVGDAE